MRRLAFLILAACSAAPAAPSSEGASEALVAANRRPVVEAPLSLANTREERVTWPVWGGAFELDGPVSASVSFDGSRDAGLVFGARGESSSVAVEVAHSASGWVLRELTGERIVRSVPLASARGLRLDFAGREVTASVAGGTQRLALSKPLPRAMGTYVRMAAGARLELAELGLSQPAPVLGAGTPLRDLAAKRGVELGTAADVWPPLSDQRFEALLGEQFGLVAPTDLYWATTRGEDEDFFFVPADLMINYATVHRQRVHGYFLVWDYGLPKWLSERRGEDLGRVLDEHVSTTVSRYRGRVAGWAVVNEAIWGPDRTKDRNGAAQYAESLWSDALGPSFIERSFRVARAADPSAKLFYNETGAEALGPKSDFMYAMAKDLVARDVPIDGVGFQFHLDAAALPTMASVRANLERFAALGLDVHITELDVSLANVATPEPAKLDLQARVYADVLGVCLAIPRCRSYTVFGVGDRHAWNKLGDASPLLFDVDFAPKPAFFSVQSGLAASPF